MENNSTNKNILVVLAHPDDESYGMGGTLAKFADLGAQIVLICATRGEAGIQGIEPERAGRIRERELKQAAENLNIRLFFLDYLDGTLSQLETKIFAQQLSIWIATVEPGLIITFGPDGVSGHPDHIAVSNAVTRAVEHYFPNINLLYLAASEATKLGCGVTETIHHSRHLISVDISDFKLAKVKAIQSHKSQNKELTGIPESELGKIACFENFSIANMSEGQKETLKWFKEKAK